MRQDLNWINMGDRGTECLTDAFNALVKAQKAFQTIAIQKLGAERFSYRDLGRGNIGIGCSPSVVSKGEADRTDVQTVELQALIARTVAAALAGQAVKTKAVKTK